MNDGSFSIVKFIDVAQRHLCYGVVFIDEDGDMPENIEADLLADAEQYHVHRLVHPDFEFMTDEQFMEYANEWLHEPLPSLTQH